MKEKFSLHNKVALIICPLASIDILFVHSVSLTIFIVETAWSWLAPQHCAPWYAVLTSLQVVALASCMMDTMMKVRIMGFFTMHYFFFSHVTTMFTSTSSHSPVNMPITSSFSKMQNY